MSAVISFMEDTLAAPGKPLAPKPKVGVENRDRFMSLVALAAAVAVAVAAVVCL